MVLLHDGAQVTTLKELRAIAAKQPSTAKFLQAPVTPVPSKASLCVLQKEKAVVPKPHEFIQYVGSVDATTCLLVFVVGKHHVAVAHMDDSDASIAGLFPLSPFKGAAQGASAPRATETKEVEDNGSKASLPEDEVTVHLVGSFAMEDDVERVSEGLVASVLQQLNDMPFPVTLGIAAILEENTEDVDGTPRPKVISAALRLSDEALLPVTFEGAIPDATLRSARMFGPEIKDLVPVFNGLDKGSPATLTIPPFDIDPLPQPVVQHLLSMDDAQLLNATSTSPKAEPPYFTEHMRDVLRFVGKHQSTASVFKHGPVQWDIGSAGWSAVAH